MSGTITDSNLKRKNRHLVIGLLFIIAAVVSWSLWYLHKFGFSPTDTKYH